MIYYIAQTESYLSLAYSRINIVAFPSCDAASVLSAHTDDVSVPTHYSITAIINSDGGDALFPCSGIVCIIYVLSSLILVVLCTKRL